MVWKISRQDRFIAARKRASLIVQNNHSVCHSRIPKYIEITPYAVDTFHSFGGACVVELAIPFSGYADSFSDAHKFSNKPNVRIYFPNPNIMFGFLGGIWAYSNINRIWTYVFPIRIAYSDIWISAYTMRLFPISRHIMHINRKAYLNANKIWMANSTV